MIGSASGLGGAAIVGRALLLVVLPVFWTLTPRANPPPGISPASADGPIEVHLYNNWVYQMNIVALMAGAPYARDRYERLLQVARVEGQNERAEGMAFVLIPDGSTSASGLAQLCVGLESINLEIAKMLTLMETGYTRSESSQVAPADIRFIRRLVLRRVLGGLPRTASSAGQVEGLVPRLSAAASYLASLVGSHFSEHPPTPTPGGYPPYPARVRESRAPPSQ